MNPLLSLLFLAHPFSLELEKGNVDSVVGQPHHLFVHFYTDGCRHCARMAPHWNDLVRMYRPLAGVVMAAADCGRPDDICEALGGTTTPSVLYFAPGERTGAAFAGAREVGPLAEWVRNATGAEPYTAPGSVLFVPPGEIDAAAAEGGWVLVVVDNHRARAYDHAQVTACEAQREIQFRALSNVDYAKEAARLCRNDAGQCVVLTNGEETHQYEGDVETQAILAFLAARLQTDL